MACKSHYLPLVILARGLGAAAVLRSIASSVHLIILLILLISDVLIKTVVVVLIFCHFRRVKERLFRSEVSVAVHRTADVDEGQMRPSASPGRSDGQCILGILGLDQSPGGFQAHRPAIGWSEGAFDIDL